METLLGNIELVSNSRGFVSPDLHLRLRKLFKEEEISQLEAGKQIALHLLNPLLQQTQKPSDGSIELLDLLRTLMYILDYQILPEFSKWLFNQLVKQPWSVYAVAPLFTATVNLLSLENTSLNVKTCVRIK